MTNHYNCPIVISYPEVVKNNIEDLKEHKMKFLNPFFSLDNEKVLIKRIVKEFNDYHVSYEEAKMQ